MVIQFIGVCGIGEMDLVPCRSRHEVVALLTARKRVLDRQHMTDQPRLDPVVVLIGEAALIIEDASAPDVVVEIAEVLPARRKAAEAHHTRIHAVADQVAVKGTEGGIGEGVGLAASRPNRAMQPFQPIEELQRLVHISPPRDTRSRRAPRKGGSPG